MPRQKNRGQQYFFPTYQAPTRTRRWKMASYIRLSKEDLQKIKNRSSVLLLSPFSYSFLYSPFHFYLPPAQYEQGPKYSTCRKGTSCTYAVSDRQSSLL